MRRDKKMMKVGMNFNSASRYSSPLDLIKGLVGFQGTVSSNEEHTRMTRHEREGIKTTHSTLIHQLSKSIACNNSREKEPLVKARRM
jgi:hypothetical protein